jgi:hypothetical protein
MEETVSAFEIEWSVPIPSLPKGEDYVISETEAVQQLAALLEQGWSPEMEAAIACGINAICESADAIREGIRTGLRTPPHPIKDTTK